jgi:hypothetical protein
MEPSTVDDGPTLAALGVLAFAIADVGHEALGHGLATLAVGGKIDLLTTCYLNSSGNYSKWIPAAGGLTNLAVGLASLAALRLFSRLGRISRYFLVLVAAFNLFFAFGYPAYSGFARFGDWAAVIDGLEPRWMWRALLVVVAVGGYYGSMRLLAPKVAPLAGIAGSSAGELSAKARLRRMTLIPYVASLVLAALAGSLNPKGLSTLLTAGVPAAAAAFGLTQMDHLVSSGGDGSLEEVSAPMERSLPWIVAAVVVLVVFVAVLGPGLRFS